MFAVPPAPKKDTAEKSEYLETKSEYRTSAMISSVMEIVEKAV